MNKALEYAKQVVAGELVAPKQVKQQCKNFIDEFEIKQNLEDYEFEWSDKIQAKVEMIIQQLNFARGAKSAQPMYENLAGFQWFLILNTFCWVYKDFPEKRKIREVVFTVARKNAKSVLACVMHIIGFFLDEENQTHYIGSNTKQQANIIFDELTGIIKSSPNMLEFFNIKKTYIEFIPKNCRIVPLSGDASKADGTMVYMASIDELGASNDIFKMVSSLETGAFGPRNPLIIKISTSYPVENAFNYWQETVEGITKNTFSADPNPRRFGLIFAIDEPDKEIDGKKRWEMQEAWPEANPLVAAVDDLWEKLVEDYHTKKDVPSDMFLFKVKNLNMWMQQNDADDDAFVDLKTLKVGKTTEIESWDWWKGKTNVIIGIDLSLVTDNTAVTFLWYDPKEKLFYAKNLVMYPADKEDHKELTEKLPYGQWARQGYCYPIGTNAIDFNEMADIIVDIVKTYDLNIASVAFDSKYSFVLMERLNDELEMEIAPESIIQDSRHLGDAVSNLQRILYAEQFKYAPNPLMESAFVNGILEFRQGKPYVKKQNVHRNKIDNLFSTFNAIKFHLWLEMNNYYDTEADLVFEI